MNQTPKIIEDAVEEFREKFRHCSCELWEGDTKPSDIQKWLTKTLTHTHTQAKEEEREKIAKMFEGLPNEIDFETMAQKVRYIWQSLSNNV